MGDVENLAVVTFQSLCESHSKLLLSQAEETLSSEAVSGFLADAADAGTQIESVAERDAVRSMMNYWSATLSRQIAAGDGQQKSADLASTAAIAGDRPTLAPFDPGKAPSLREEDNPFVGLSAFGPEQADVFFGRGEAIAQLLETVKNNPIVLVSGASGTGKSSLVRAGLIPRLKGPEEKADWLIVSAVPGFDPLGNILAAIAPEGASLEWREQARDAVEKDPAHLLEIARAACAGRPLLFLIDQFEEMFSLAPPTERSRTGLALAALSTAADTHIVLTIREEYVERERSEATMEGLDFSNICEFHVPPMSACELREAITAPGGRAGLVFQDGVVDRIVADVAAEPAALPLLQFALLQLWRRREGNRVTLKTYEDVGGPTTALSRAAEAAFQTLRSAEAQDNAKLIFQQLVRPSLIYDAVRDRVTRAQLETLLPAPSVRTVLEPFVAAALVRVSPGAERGEDRIEIAHEALIRNWERLRRWSFELRDREEVYLSLVAKAEDWQRSARTRGHLLFGKALRDAEKIRLKHSGRARSDPDRDRIVDAFLVASRSQSRRALQWGAAAAALGLLVVIAFFWAQLTKWGLESDLLAVVRQEKFLSQSERAEFNSDAPRQFVQMLLSRGTIAVADLPAGYARMLPEAAPWRTPASATTFTPDFLGRPDSEFFPAPPRGSRRLSLPNLLLWLDPRTGAPLMAISQSERQAAVTGNVVPSQQLFRSPQVADTLNERAVAQNGLGLAHLVDWREIGWGAHAREAVDSTNLLSTMFPVPLRGSEYQRFSSWSTLGSWLLVRHNPTAEKVIYISGVVPQPGPAGRMAPPRLVWKVAVSTTEDGELVVDAAMLPGSAVAGDELPGKTSLKAIQKAAGVNFTKLIGLISGTGTAAQKPAAAESVAVADERIYIQTNHVDAEVLGSLQRALGTARFKLPPSEEVGTCVYPPLLRYYRPEDRKVAEHAASIASGPLRAAGYTESDVQAKLFVTRSKARPGHLELWVCGNIGP
jgi:hypothetical protein